MASVLLIVILWRSIFAKFDAGPYDHQGLIDAHIEMILPGFAAQGDAA
jgi:hypothetical protein